MMPQEKITRSLDLIAAELVGAARPVICSSFGKDSLVLMDLVYTIIRAPILFFVQYAKQFPEKYRFAWQFIEAYKLLCYTLPSRSISHVQDGDYFEIFSQFGGTTTGPLMMSMGCREWKGTDKEFVCAVESLLQPIAEAVDYPWDLTFIGHKAADPVPLAARVEFVGTAIESGTTRLCLPLADWTDEEVWAYIKDREIPYDTARYDDKNETTNPDVFPTCFACLDTRRRGEQVFCPVLEAKIDNRAHPDQWHAQQKLRFLQSVGYARFRVFPPVDPEVTKKFLEREEQWPLWSLTKQVYEEHVYAIIEDLPDLTKAPNAFPRLREEWIRLERRCGEAGIYGWIAGVQKANTRMQRFFAAVGAEPYAEDDEVRWVKKIVNPTQQVFPSLREIAALVRRKELTHA